DHHVLFVRRRDDDAFESRLRGGLDLVGDATHWQDIAPNRQRAGHGEVLVDRHVFESADDRRSHRDGRRVAVDAALADLDELDVNVLLGDVLVRELLDDRRDVLHGFLGHFLELAGGDHAARTLRGGDFGHYGQHDARVRAHHGKPVDTADDAALRDRHLVVLPALHERIGELLFDRARAVFGLEYVVACGELGVLGTGDVACNPNQATQITHLEREMTLPTRSALSFEDDLLD